MSLEVKFGEFKSIIRSLMKFQIFELVILNSFLDHQYRRECFNNQIQLENTTFWLNDVVEYVKDLSDWIPTSQFYEDIDFKEACEQLITYVNEILNGLNNLYPIINSISSLLEQNNNCYDEKCLYPLNNF